MSNTIVIYASRYGSTRQYAEWIAQDLGCTAKPVSDCKGLALEAYDTILFGGGLYVGAINGIQFLTKHLESLKHKRIIVFTVGLSPTEDASYFRPLMEKALTPQALKQIQCFHFRGGMDKSRLSLPHKAMMAALCAMLRKIPEEQRTAEQQGMFDCNSSSQDFSSRESIRPLLEAAHL